MGSGSLAFRGVPLFQLVSFAEGFSHFVADGKVVVVAGVVDDRLQARYVDFTTFVHDAFIGRSVDNLANHEVALHVVGNQFAFQCHGQFVDNRSVDKFRLCGMEAGFREFVRFLVA